MQLHSNAAGKAISSKIQHLKVISQQQFNRIMLTTLLYTKINKLQFWSQMMLKIIGELALLGAIASVFIVAAQGRAQERAAEEASGREYMRTLDEVSRLAKNRLTLASWAYESNITKYNEDKYVSITDPNRKVIKLILQFIQIL